MFGDPLITPMVSPIADNERRQFYIAGTVAMAVVATFWIGAFVAGQAHWASVFVPLGMLALMIRGLTRARQPRLARWALWAAIVLITGGGLYAFVRTWRIVHHVSG